MKNKLKKGQWVKSNYRVSWKGIIIEETEPENCYLILPMIYRHDKPYKKKRSVMTLHMNWLTKISSERFKSCLTQ